VVRCRVVRGEMRKLPTWPIVTALLVLGGLVPARVAADSSAGLHARASKLQNENAGLAARSHSALLELYALDSKLARERAHIVALRIEVAQVRAARALAERNLATARRSLAAANRALALRVQQLYEQGDSDPVAVVLGASSVTEAMNRLDTLGRVSDIDRMVLDQSRQAHRSYQREAKALASRQGSLGSLLADASQTAAALEQARASRGSYLASLAARRRLNASSIAGLEQQAQAIETRTKQLAATPTPTGAGVAQPGAITVTATGYSLRGRTATGAPVGWGVVAVDPGVIPLGTRMTIPGYGEGIAADTGSAVVGSTIDLWFPTRAQALAWGRRTVTITLH
jgi:3D (Asp-Asp-Asp) domain-containing protein